MSTSRSFTDEERRTWAPLTAVLELLPSRIDAQLLRDAGLTHFDYATLSMLALADGRRMRMIAWGAVTFEAIGVISVGILSVTHPELFARDSVWSHFGSGYGYVPLVLPFLGISWLYHSNPARITQN